MVFARGIQLEDATPPPAFCVVRYPRSSAGHNRLPTDPFRTPGIL